jgi:hypothetical protein
VPQRIIWSAGCDRWDRWQDQQVNYRNFVRLRTLQFVVIAPSACALGVAAANSDLGQPWGVWVVAALAWLLLCAVVAWVRLSRRRRGGKTPAV